MAREPSTEHPTHPSPEQDPSPLEGTRSMAYETEDVAEPLLGVALMEEILPPPRKNWIRHWISVPAVRVFITLIGIAAISFAPAFLSDRDNSYFFDSYPYGEDGVVIYGYVYHFDWQQAQKVSVKWCIDGQGKYRLPINGTLPAWCLPPNVAVDVYINNASNPVYSYDPVNIPVNGSNGRVLVDSSHGFTTEHDIDLGNPYYAPLEHYYFSAFVFVIEKATNNSVPVTLFGVLNDGPGDFTVISASDVGPTTNVFTYDNGSGPTTVEAMSYTMHPGITHSGSSRALTFSMLVINWILTLCSMITTSIIFNRTREVKDGIALLPITIILTVPAVRNLYVGAPTYGIFLDVIGFFPQMLIVVTCTIFVLCGYAAKYIWGTGTGYRALAVAGT